MVAPRPAPTAERSQGQADVSITLHRGDLPEDLAWGELVAVDTETMGLNPQRDRLCLVQLSAGDGDCHAVQIPPPPHAAPNLARLLGDPGVTKLFHFARFDIATIARHLGVDPERALDGCLARFCARFETMRGEVERGGARLDRMTLDELDRAWEKAKSTQRRMGREK